MEEILTDPDNLTAKKISQKLKIPLATVYRQLEILCEERFLIQNVNKTFIPGPKIREIILKSLPYEPKFTLRRSFLRKLTEGEKSFAKQIFSMISLFTCIRFPLATSLIRVWLSL